MTWTARALWYDFDERNLLLTHLCGIVFLTQLMGWEFAKQAQALKLRETQPRENSLKIKPIQTLIPLATI